MPKRKRADAHSPSVAEAAAFLATSSATKSSDFLVLASELKQSNKLDVDTWHKIFALYRARLIESTAALEDDLVAGSVDPWVAAVLTLQSAAFVMYEIPDKRVFRSLERFLDVLMPRIEELTEKDYARYLRLANQARTAAPKGKRERQAVRDAERLEKLKAYVGRLMPMPHGHWEAAAKHAGISIPTASRVWNTALDKAGIQRKARQVAKRKEP